MVPYYLDEEKDWDLQVTELERAFVESERKGVCIRALCVINPGNPTGNHLSEQSLIDVKLRDDNLNPLFRLSNSANKNKLSCWQMKCTNPIS